VGPRLVHQGRRRCRDRRDGDDRECFQKNFLRKPAEDAKGRNWQPMVVQGLCRARW
jgi:hypothetical protein